MPLHEIKHYEMMFIIPAKYAGEELNTIKDKVKKILEDQEAKITSEESMGRRRLAYPIKHVYQGFYFVMEFDIAPEKLARVNTLLKLVNEVLRFMIVEKKILSEKEIEAQKRLEAMVEAELREKGIIKDAENEKVNEEEKNVNEDSNLEEVRKEEKEEVVKEESKEESEQKENKDDVTGEVKDEEQEEAKEEVENKVNLEELDENKLDDILSDDIKEQL